MVENMIQNIIENIPLSPMVTCPYCNELVFIKDIYYKTFPDPEIKPKGPFCPECDCKLKVTVSTTDDTLSATVTVA